MFLSILPTDALKTFPRGTGAVLDLLHLHFGNVWGALEDPKRAVRLSLRPSAAPSDAMTRSRQRAKGIKMNRIVAIVTASVLSTLIGGSAFAAEVPYMGNGDPLGLTGSKSTAALHGVSFDTANFALEMPYSGHGDPMGFVSGGIDFSVTASVRRATHVPYTGNGDRDDLI